MKKALVSLILIFAILMSLSSCNKENESLGLEVFLHTKTGVYNISKDTRPILSSKDSDDSIAGTFYWEPGYVAPLYLSVKNSGSVETTFVVALEATDIVGNANEVLTYFTFSNITMNDSINRSDLSKADRVDRVEKGTNIVTEQITLAPGEEHFFLVAIHMDETASGTYQNASIVFYLNVITDSSMGDVEQ